MGSKGNQTIQPFPHKLELGELSDMLMADGLISKQQFDNFKLKASFRNPGALHPLLVIADQRLTAANAPQQLLSQEFLTEWLAKRINVPYFRVDPLKIDVATVTALVSQSYAERNQLLPVQASPTFVVIATAEPWWTDWIDELSRILRKEIRLVLANPAEIRRYIGEFYSVSRSVSGAADHRINLPGDLTNLEQMLELGKKGNLDANDQHVVNIVDWLLQYAFDQRASDIHLEPRRDKGNIRFRIDGMLHMVYQLPAPIMSAVTSRLKILGRMDLAEKRRPLDGRLKTRSPVGEEVELRLSTLPTAFGEKMVMRIFDPDVLVKKFADLGFNKNEEALWQQMIKQPNGIILVTGPTGSGKTTTLYSTLKYLAKPELNICTIEDPIEMVVPDFNQMQVQHNIELDFASGVRALLRQDPDIIMVGEIRDIETAEMAIQAAQTGHLVISTLHTNDAVAAITRLLDIGVPRYMISASLLGVVAQRLVRTLCPHCRQPVPTDMQMWNALSRPWKSTAPDQVMAPVGCAECRNTGYLGRSGIYEMLPMSAAIKRLIHTTDGDVAAIRAQAQKEGMRALRINGIQKVAQGVTSLAEVARVAPLYDED